MLQGSLSVYERDGIYQLNVRSPCQGAGDLFRFLAAEGQTGPESLFSANKRPIPVLPSKIGIVTSLTGAALKDMLSILHRRHPHGQVIIAPALVQGVEAPQSIASALAALNRHGQAQVIILGRGGGSLEELWAFNTEEVARAIAASKIPVVSAVGHETDYTIADLAADLRAPTPSAAAAMVVPDLQEELLLLHQILERSKKALKAKLLACGHRVDSLYCYSSLSRPQYLFNSQHQHLEFTEKRLFEAWNNNFKDQFNKLQQTAKTGSLSPLKTLKRGLLCQDVHGNVVSKPPRLPRGPAGSSFIDGDLLCLVQVRNMMKNNIPARLWI